MKKHRILASSLLLLSSHSTYAADLDPVIVTATRTAQTADETLASVTVITRQDIERQQARSVQDVLRGVPGVAIANNGGAGKSTSMFLRGTESDHVLVLIDGIKTGSATLGTSAFQDIPIEQIERIEVVRGPRSSLYGSEAVGGVIQIFTRRGSGELKPFFSVGRGSYDTYSASAGVSGGGENGWFNLSASGTDTDGFNSCYGKPFPNGAGCFTIEPDKDGNQNLSGALRAGYRFENNLEVDAHALRTTSDTQFDGSFVNESESVQQTLGGTLRFSPTQRWLIALAAGQSRDESDNFKNGSLQSRFDTERDSFSLQNDLAIADSHLLTFGADYQDDKVSGTTDYLVTSRDNKGVFAQYQVNLADHDFQLSLRQDDNEQFGTNTTGGAAWGYALGDTYRLIGTYGTAFKAPTFNELYFPGYGVPTLEPEDSRSYEIGIRRETTWGHWSLNAYQTRVNNLIAFDANAFAPANIEAARIRGLEAILATKLANWHVNTSLTLLDPKDRSRGENRGNTAPRRAKQSLNLDADRQFGSYSLGATLYAQGKRYDDLANTRKLGGYTTVDLRAGYTFARDWLVQTRIENLLDKDYETAAFYNQPGRSLFVTLRYQP